MNEHLLLVKSSGRLWGLPMGAVEQTFTLEETTRCRAGSKELVLYRGSTLQITALGAALKEPEGNPGFGVVLWAGGRRQVFAVDSLVGQMELDTQAIPAGTKSRFCRAAAIFRDEIVPVLEPGVVLGLWDPGSSGGFGFSEMQRSALAEVANIGSGNAATALSQLVGRAVEVEYTETLLATLAEAVDKMGAPAEQSAVIDTPVADSGGRVLLLFPETAAQELCRLLGVSISDEMGRSALKEIGNILASSYLNAIVEMTGLPLEPEPPEIEIDLLGQVVGRRLTRELDPSDPAILMLSAMTVEASSASFAFLFVPQLAGVGSLLEALGVGAL